MKTRQVTLTQNEFEKSAKSIDCSSAGTLIASVKASFPADYAIEETSEDKQTIKMRIGREWKNAQGLVYATYMVPTLLQVEILKNVRWVRLPTYIRLI